MTKEDTPPDFIGEIYDTVLDPSRWAGVLEQVARYVGGRAASVFSKDPMGNGGQIVHGFGIDPHYSQLYFDKYGRLDPIAAGRAPTAFGEPSAVGDFIPYDHYRETTFFREWAEPQGLVDFISVPVDQSPTGLTFLGVPRDQPNGIVDEAAREHMRRVAPHIRRALSIGKLVDLGQAQAGAFAETIDRLGAAVFLIGTNGGMCHSNIAGRALLAEGDLLYDARDCLMARAPAVDRALQAALAAATRGTDDIGAASIMVPLTSSDETRYVAHVLPLGADARRHAGIGSGAVAAVFVHKATLAQTTLPDVMSRHFKLTPTELRVLSTIIDVGGGPEAAERLGVAESTVKTHLHRLYQKTGTRGQVDLVKLVAGFSSPLLS